MKEEESFEMKTNLRDQIIAILQQIPDPELGISLWDLGLIYKVKEKGGKVEISMTLTSAGCPLFSSMEEQIKNEVQKIPGVKSVFVNLIFDPPWSIEKLSKKARKKLGF